MKYLILIIFFLLSACSNDDEIECEPTPQFFEQVKKGKVSYIDLKDHQICFDKYGNQIRY